MARTKRRMSKARATMTDGSHEPGAKAAKAQTFEERQTLNDLDENIAHMDVRLLADLFAQKLKRYRKDLTAVEMNDLYLPASAFRDTSSFEDPRTLKALPSFLKEFTAGGKSDLSTTCQDTGSPHTIIITSAGLRAADLTRSLREFQTKDAMVAKLFAKHIKLEEAIKGVKKWRIGIGVGTPTRVKDLLDADALRLGNLARIVIDGSYLDQKKRGIFDMKDVFDPLLDLLKRPEIAERYGADDKKVELMIF